LYVASKPLKGDGGFGATYDEPSPKQGAQKRKNAVFRLKLYSSERKSATKFLCVKTVSDKVVRHLLTLSIRSKMVGGDVPLKVNFASGLSEPPLGAAAVRINAFTKCDGV